MTPRNLYLTLPLALAAIAIGPSRATSADQPLHERETAAAWKAWEAGRFKDALAHANGCVREFGRQAGRGQRSLEESKKEIPTGCVTAEQKTAILKNGVLNDVAVCFYIRGRAADRLCLKELATKELNQAMKYPAARAWDARGWFWAPAEAAERFLRDPRMADKAPSEIYTTDAWAAYNKRNYRETLAHADRCEREFYQAALKTERSLADRNERVPNGAVTDSVKKKIQERGLLNDVSTCLYLKGRAAEASRDYKTAAKAYERAMTLPRGRCWDDNGWFWSPAEAAGDRLAGF